MLFSAACERNKEAILAVLQEWLPPGALLQRRPRATPEHPQRGVGRWKRMAAAHVANFYLMTSFGEQG